MRCPIPQNSLGLGLETQKKKKVLGTKPDLSRGLLKGRYDGTKGLVLWLGHGYNKDTKEAILAFHFLTYWIYE